MNVAITLVEFYINHAYNIIHIIYVLHFGNDLKPVTCRRAGIP